jgi:hypothetical protein
MIGVIAGKEVTKRTSSVNARTVFDPGNARAVKYGGTRGGSGTKADEGMGENGRGGQSAEGRNERPIAREETLSSIACHGQADASEREGGGLSPAMRAGAALIIACAVSMFVSVEVALAATQSILTLPDESPEAAMPAPDVPVLPQLPTRNVAPHEIHVPDESLVEPVRPYELQEGIRQVAPKATEKHLPPAEQAGLPQSSATVVQAGQPADKHIGQEQQGQFAARTPAAAPATAAPLPPSDLVSALIQRGDELLQLRDIAAARLLYERAALSGNAHAAMLAGKTYDPLYFAETGITGIAPDRTKAIEWYGAATALGDAEATTRADKLRGASNQ